ncbi:MAG TPA: DUF3187 family protein [Gemmatimonadales bacterium]|nr:DUF3187 family protein [Gemmatimonadales bacterium]
MPQRFGPTAPLTALFTVAACLASPVAAQSDSGLPAHYSINPVAVSRSGLYFEPYRSPHPGWRYAVQLDYGNMIEYGAAIDGRVYLLDAEAATFHLNVGRDLGARTFVIADVPVRSVYAGVMDGFLDWYHNLIGIPIPERQLRPRNQFEYRVELPNGDTLVRHRLDPSLGDIRLGLGVRHSDAVQSVLSITLPTTTGAEGYGRATPSVSLLNTWRARWHPRLRYEGSLDVGYTPATGGPMAQYQHTTFLALTSGVRWNFAGVSSMFGNLYYHSSYYGGTGFASLDHPELSFDYGFIFRTHAGGEWRLGMTEDLIPTSPAIDVVFKVGRSW